MAMITTDSVHYLNIANAIRKRGGSGSYYKPEDMPAGIEVVFETGKSVGVGTGYEAGYQKGLEEGGNSTTARIENDILYITKM